MEGSSSSLKVSDSTKSLYRALRFYDNNNNGVIDKVPLWKLWQYDEGYTSSADIDGDGRIVLAEAKYYLRNYEYVGKEIKQGYPLTDQDRTVLLALFNKRLLSVDLGSTSIDKEISEIAAGVADCGLLSEALDIAAAIGDISLMRPDLKAPAIANIADRIATADMSKEEKNKLFKKALNIALQHNHPPKRAYAILSVKLAMIKAGCSKDEISTLFSSYETVKKGR